MEKEADHGQASASLSSVLIEYVWDHVYVLPRISM